MNRFATSMETGALWRRPLRATVGVDLCAAASGGPALGAVGFMHRGSALNDLDFSNAPFARVEYVRKLGHDLVAGDPDAAYGIFQVKLGYVRRFRTEAPVAFTAGAALDAGVVLAALESAYGTRLPLGAFVFVGLQPPKAGPMHHGGSGM